MTGVYLWVMKVIKRLLVGTVGLLKIVHHQVAVAEASPYLPIVWIELQNAIDVFHRSLVLLLVAKDSRNSRHCSN